jgi:hypothetical protein
MRELAVNVGRLFEVAAKDAVVVTSTDEIEYAFDPGDPPRRGAPREGGSRWAHRPAARRR